MFAPFRIAAIWLLAVIFRGIGKTACMEIRDHRNTHRKPEGRDLESDEGKAGFQ